MNPILAPIAVASILALAACGGQQPGGAGGGGGSTGANGATALGANVVKLQWHTVYHRLPMMRFETTDFGYGDTAVGGSPTGRGYPTMLFGGQDFTVARFYAYWPTAATPPNAMYRVFNTDLETPDPVPNNTVDPARQKPTTWLENYAGATPVPLGPPWGAPGNRDNVGTPIHCIFPSTLNFSEVKVTLQRQGATTAEPIYVLMGGTWAFQTTQTARDADWNAYTSTSIPQQAKNPNGPSCHYCIDRYLEPGELFVLPRTILLPNTTYTCKVEATFTDASTLVISGTGGASHPCAASFIWTTPNDG